MTRRSEAGRASVLMLTRNFPPLVGGMERLLHHAYLEMLNAFDLALCAPAGSSAFVPPTDRIVEVPPNPISRFLLRTFAEGARLGWRHRPQVVLAGSGLTALPALAIGKIFRAKTITYVHGLDLVASHPLYRRVFLPAIRHCHRILANSESTRQIAIAAGVPEERISILHPGVQLPDEADLTAVERFRSNLGIGSRPVLLSVGRLTPRKGLAEFIEHSLPAIVRDVPQATLLLVGDLPRNSVAGADSGNQARINEAIGRRGLENHVVKLGMVDDDTLRLAFHAASALVFPAREIPGDVEGFGMVAIEAAAHGVPTVAFRVGGVPDAVADGVSGVLVDADDYTTFATECVIFLNQPGRFPHVRQFAAGFCWSSFGERLRALIDETMATGTTE